MTLRPALAFVALLPQTQDLAHRGPERVGRGGPWPYLPEVPGYALDELGRALVDEALLGEDVLLSLLLRVQVYSVGCGQEGKGSAPGLAGPRGPGDMAARVPTPRATPIPPRPFYLLIRKTTHYLTTPYQQDKALSASDNGHYLSNTRHLR